MDEGEFRGLTGAADRAFIEFGEQPPPQARLCVSCHGDADSPPVSALVPVLQGQSADYLRRSLEEYRGNQRQSGIMEPVAAALDARTIGDAVRFYAEMAPAASARREGGDRQALSRGRTIAENGIPEAQIPPCLACHSGRASPRFPVLAGLSAEYLRGQLDLFRAGKRDQTAYGAIMTAIGRRLGPSQIADAAAYFSSLPAGVPVAPAKDGEGGRR
jgi:cytochrome c553